MNLDLQNLYNLMKSKDLVFCYSGPIIQESLEGIAYTLRKKMEADRISFGSSQLIFSIFVEGVQNIIRYSEECQMYCNENEQERVASGIVVVGKNERGYFVVTGNNVLNKDAIYLKASLDEIKNMSKQQLRELYRKRRREDLGVQKNGAGIGLIEIARRSDEPILYSIVKENDQISFFSLASIVKCGEDKSMKQIKIEKTASTPQLIIDEEKGYVKLSGESFPENVTKFYEELMVWLDEFLETDFKSLKFDCELLYFNSSTSKLLMNLLDKMDLAAGRGKKVLVNWICKKDNDIIIECGEEFSEDYKNLYFNLILE